MITGILYIIDKLSEVSVNMSTYLYTLDDDSEHAMDYETSLLPKVFCSLHVFSELFLINHII